MCCSSFVVGCCGWSFVVCCCMLLVVIGCCCLVLFVVGCCLVFVVVFFVWRPLSLVVGWLVIVVSCVVCSVALLSVVVCR